MKAKAVQWHVLSEKEQKFLRSYGINADTEMEFFVRKPMALFWLSVLTLGVYDIYWFYKNWQIVRAATGAKWNVWVRVLFTVFYAWPLFKIMILEARLRGFQKHYSAGRLALVYVLIAYAVGWAMTAAGNSNVTFLAGFVSNMISVWVLIVVQRAASYSNVGIGEPAATFGKLAKGEKIALGIGGVFIALALIGTFYTPPKPVKPAANQQQINSAKQKVDNLTAQYNACAADLNTRRAAVDTNSQASVDAYNADYDKCEAVRQQQNKAADDYNALIGVKK